MKIDTSNMTWSDIIKYIVGIIKETEGVKLTQAMAPEFEEANEETKEFVLSFAIRDFMKNQRDELHGGACGTAFDIATGVGAAALCGEEGIVTLDMYINYISRMAGDDILIVRVRPVRIGKTMVRFLTEGLSKRTGEIVATGTVNYLLAQGKKQVNE